MRTGLLYEEVHAAAHPDGGEGLLAIILRRGFRGRGTEFFNKSTDSLQFGHMLFPAGSEVLPHKHLANPRVVDATQEGLVVRFGTVELTVYDSWGEVRLTTHLYEGDIAYLRGGGHRLVVPSESSVVEFKTGPYHGRDKDKIEIVPKLRPLEGST